MMISNEPISVFISYSHIDAAFVDRLDIDLQARNFHTWRDISKIRAGENWLDAIDKAIKQCHVLLVVVSPEAFASEHVRKEYRYAQSKGKRVIPLYCRPSDVPFDLNDIQWVNFRQLYENGLRDLLIQLSFVDTTTHPDSEASSNIAKTNFEDQEPVLVAPRPAPFQAPPNPNDLIRNGELAKAKNDLERTLVLWQWVLKIDPDFGNGTLATQVTQLIKDLQPQRAQRLRNSGNLARLKGEWGREAAAERAILELEPQDAEAKERLFIAEHNQKYTSLYELALQFVEKGDLISAKVQLELLRKVAPNYGDPEGLAKQVGLKLSGTQVTPPLKITIPSPQQISDAVLSGINPYAPWGELKLDGTSKRLFTSSLVTDYNSRASYREVGTSCTIGNYGPSISGRLAKGDFTDFAFQAEMASQQPEQEHAYYNYPHSGLIFRATSNLWGSKSTYYYFSVSNETYFFELIEGQSSILLTSGEAKGLWNKGKILIGVVAQGDYFDLYLNLLHLVGWTDRNRVGGRVGIAVGYLKRDRNWYTQILFNNAQLWAK